MIEWLCCEAGEKGDELRHLATGAIRLGPFAFSITQFGVDTNLLGNLIEMRSPCCSSSFGFAGGRVKCLSCSHHFPIDRAYWLANPVKVDAATVIRMETTFTKLGLGPLDAIAMASEVALLGMHRAPKSLPTFSAKTFEIESQQLIDRWMLVN